MTILTEPLLQSHPLLREEIAIEREAITAGVARYRRLADAAIRRGDGAALKPAERLIVHWLDTITIAIRDERRNIADGKPGQVGYVVYGPVIRSLPSRTLAAIAARVALSMCMSAGQPVPVARVANAIGRDVLAEINLKLMRQNCRDAVKELDRRFRNLSPRRVNWWAKRSLADPHTSRVAMARIGGVLLSAVIDYAAASGYDDVPIPAFEVTTRCIGRKTVNLVYLTREARKIIDDGHAIRETLRPRYLPMITPPFARDATEPPGYVKIATPIISKPTRAQKRAMAEADMGEMLGGLTALASCGQRINRRELWVVEHVWKEGGGDLGLPHARDYPRPPKPQGYDPDAPMKRRWDAVDPEVKKAYKRAASEAIARDIANKADREEFLQKLYVARKFKDRPAIYFPHQLDFRGRAYPIPPHLNHQGDDLCRGLLEFAEAKPADGRSLYWVAGQAADSFGHDKLTFDQRYEWTMDHLAQIVAAAKDPINDGWWRTAKKPWQFLAACFALTDPEAAARLPIQRDGTANGLQWYAALGRDSVGAAAVNMVPGDTPNDIYGNVADLVRAAVEQDILNDEGRLMTFREKGDTVRIRAGLLAAAALPYVNRDTAKPIVMPKPYGIKPVGGRRGVGVALEKQGVTGRDVYRLSAYLAPLIFDAVTETCAAATQIMDWLRGVAATVAGAGHAVSWTTPMGFKVVQPYRKFRSVQVQTILQNITLRVDDESLPVNVTQQVDGFAPNWVHSLDACHMFRTATACHARGVAFAATHDAFRTHAATVEIMDRILREQFVDLNRPNLPMLLADELRQAHPDLDIPDPPPRGDYDIEQVLVSPRFFS